MEVTEWSEEALENSEIIARGLHEMAWDDASIQAFLDRYLDIRNSDLPRRTMISRIRELLGMRRVVEATVTDDWINVPLYRFGAPPVEGASVEYSEGNTAVAGGGWKLKVFGVGTGDSTSLQVSKSRTFVAGPGICKLVYIPIKLRVAKVAIFDRDRLVGRGHTAQVAPLEESGDEHLRRRGCKTLPNSACRSGPADPLDILDCSLSGDTSGDIHHDNRSWESDTAREIAVHLGKIAEVSALVQIKRTRQLRLSFALPSGHDYRAYLCPSVTWWERPRS